jgi:mRNA-degrading endonuclease YafQ of YafQ-DinJ toxin-antitoxin module
MWQIYEHRKLVGRLSKIPIEILKRYEKWKDIVTVSGPEGLRLIKGFHDEALTGEWIGHRSSRLGFQWRIPYRIEKQNLFVFVLDISAHDYRRK